MTDQQQQGKTAKVVFLVVLAPLAPGLLMGPLNCGTVQFCKPPHNWILSHQMGLSLSLRLHAALSVQLLSLALLASFSGYFSSRSTHLFIRKHCNFRQSNRKALEEKTASIVSMKYPPYFPPNIHQNQGIKLVLNSNH